MASVSALYYPGHEMPLDWLRAFLLFHDQVIRIVPAEHSFQDKEDLLRFREAFPDSIKDVPSSTALVELDEHQLLRLDKAFAEIDHQTRDRKRRFEMKFHRGDHFQMATEIVGYAFLHRSKVSRQMLDLLNKYDLGPERYDPIAKGITGGTDWLLVKLEASNLILSVLADRMACSLGYGTVTSETLDYSLVVLNSSGVGLLSGKLPGPTATRLLASMIIDVQIPASINDIPLSTYAELRKEFADIRGPFEKLVKEAQSAEGLLEISDANTLSSRLHELSQGISSQIDGIQRKSRFTRLEKWGLFSLGSLIALGSAIPVEFRLAVALAAVGIAIEGLALVAPELESNEKDTEKIARKIASLKQQLPGEVRKSVEALL